VLDDGRALVMADPYCRREASKDQVTKEARSSSDYVRSNLFRHGFTITHHRDSIPWPLRLHDRRRDIYLCDCFSARKESKA
jgi:hypothetical protein